MPNQPTPTDHDVVLVKWPNAIAIQTAPAGPKDKISYFWIWCGDSSVGFENERLGRGATEAEAWASARSNLAQTEEPQSAKESVLSRFPKAYAYHRHGQIAGNPPFDYYEIEAGLGEVGQWESSVLGSSAGSLEREAWENADLRTTNRIANSLRSVPSPPRVEAAALEPERGTFEQVRRVAFHVAARAAANSARDTCWSQALYDQIINLLPTEHQTPYGLNLPSPLPVREQTEFSSKSIGSILAAVDAALAGKKVLLATARGNVSMERYAPQPEDLTITVDEFVSAIAGEKEE